MDSINLVKVWTKKNKNMWYHNDTIKTDHIDMELT
jgi:hypothetical protein